MEIRGAIKEMTTMDLVLLRSKTMNSSDPSDIQFTEEIMAELKNRATQPDDRPGRDWKRSGYQY